MFDSSLRHQSQSGKPAIRKVAGFFICGAMKPLAGSGRYLRWVAASKPYQDVLLTAKAARSRYSLRHSTTTKMAGTCRQPAVRGLGAKCSLDHRRFTSLFLNQAERLAIRIGNEARLRRTRSFPLPSTGLCSSRARTAKSASTRMRIDALRTRTRSSTETYLLIFTFHNNGYKLAKMPRKVLFPWDVQDRGGDFIERKTA